MLSVAAAASFLPLRPVLLLNFLSDIPGTTIVDDRVDPEQTERSRVRSLRSVRTFMIVFGPLS
jgi:Mg2+-importing ATPase